jgi:hypothetical protein
MGPLKRGWREAATDGMSRRRQYETIGVFELAGSVVSGGVRADETHLITPPSATARGGAAGEPDAIRSVVRVAATVVRTAVAMARAAAGAAASLSPTTVLPRGGHGPRSRAAPLFLDT